MRPTVEVRWFFRGPLPEAVVRWSEAAAGARAWEERTDRYVRTAATDLGVKLRGGNAVAGTGLAVEAKHQVARLGEVRFNDGAAGGVERWRKWSFVLSEEAVPETDDWIAVHKRRRNVPFAVEGAGVRPVEAEATAPSGCSFEVSELRVAGGTWWSVCLEAWGEDEAALPGVLRRVAGHAFGCGTPPALPPGRSLSYPAWLAGEAGA